MNVKKWLSWRRYYWRCLLTKDGEYELRILRRYVPRDRVAIDVGANEGIYAYHLSRYAHSVVAFEPNPCYDRALRFLPRNVTVRVEALIIRIGHASPAHPRHRYRRSEGWATLETTDLHLARSIDVPVRRLDDLELGRVGFMKIDVDKGTRWRFSRAPTLRSDATDRPFSLKLRMYTAPVQPQIFSAGRQSTAIVYGSSRRAALFR